MRSGLGALPDPRAPIPVVYWRCCAGCAAWLAHPYEPPQDEHTYCGDCEKRRSAACAGFDPRPHPSPDACVRRHTALGFWVVLAREKDTLTLRRLGLTDTTPVTVHLSDTYPRTNFRQSP